MRAVAAAVLSAVLLTACSTKPKLDELASGWRGRVNAAVPVGTDLVKAKAWFESQGAKVPPTLAKNEAIVWLETVRA
jgi:outer membrane murein-binding lipoprotein Lpp